MRSRPPEPVKAFATLRVAGDDLVPEQVTRLLKIVPTLAYAKGERYSGGSRSPNLTGRTGVWYFCTDGIVASDDLQDHLAFLLTQVLQDAASAKALRALMRRHALRAVVTCFWHGPSGGRRPVVPRAVIQRLRALPAAIETDFNADGEAGRDAA